MRNRIKEIYMVTKDKIIDYCCETPGNTNKMVLDSLLEDFGGSDKPTGTIEITENGSVDVAQYATADVNVSGSSEPTKVVIYEAADPTAARPSRGYKIEIDDTYDYLEIKYLINNSENFIEKTLNNPQYVIIPLKNGYYNEYGISQDYFLTGLATDQSQEAFYMFRRCFITKGDPLQEMPAYFRDDMSLRYGSITSADSYAAIPIKLTLIKY